MRKRFYQTRFSIICKNAELLSVQRVSAQRQGKNSLHTAMSRRNCNHPSKRRTPTIRKCIRMPRSSRSENVAKSYSSAANWQWWTGDISLLRKARALRHLWCCTTSTTAEPRTTMTAITTITKSLQASFHNQLAPFARRAANPSSRIANQWTRKETRLLDIERLNH